MRTVEQRTWSIHSTADFGRAIADIRALHGLTQQELAAQTATPRAYLAKLEAGLTIRMIERVLRLLRRMGAEVTVSVTRPGGNGEG